MRDIIILEAFDWIVVQDDSSIFFRPLFTILKLKVCITKCVQVSLSSDLYVVLDVPMDVYFKCNYGTG